MSVHAVLLAALLVSAASALAAAPPLPADLEALDPLIARRIEERWQAVVEEPESALRWLELGRVYHAHELTVLAETCYREAVRLQPEEAEAWYALAHAQLALGEPELAVESLDAVIRLVPSYSPAHWRRGMWLAELGRDGEAEEAFRRAVEVAPRDAAGQVGLARSLLQRGELVEAIERLRQVLSADPANGVAGQLLGSALRAQGDEVGARRALSMTTGMGAHFVDPWHEKILESATGVGNLLRLLSARLERGEVEAVVGELEKLRRAHPADVGVLNKLSEAYLHRGDPQAALEVLRVAFEIDPNEFATLIHLSQAEQARGEVATALAWADRAAEVNPRFWQVHFSRAALLHRAGRYRECLSALDSAMRTGAHQNPNAWLMRGDALIRLGELEEAGGVFAQATARFPFLGQAFVGLALVRAEQARVDEAREALSGALALQPPDETTAAVEATLLKLESESAADDGGPLR